MVIHQQLRTLKRTGIIQRGSFNVGTAGGKYASAVDSIHHIQQQGGSLYQSAAGVRQHLRRQREVTAGEDFAVVLQTVCGVQGNPASTLYRALVTQGRSTDIQCIPAHQNTTGTVVHATGGCQRQRFALQMPAVCELSCRDGGGISL
ncbi:hypothetical protein HmCmsJML126_04595 [Escherichia coli]|nr:hypothetical protein C3984_03505 [Escherichia coli]GCN26017.1 hypothetical protein ExPCM18_04332 [Escherichia coli]GCN99262.1 hypothetical protein ExPCM12_02356 [Escherichia coli]GCR19074.1 hypothetical protein ExPECSC078_04826 [Escherichia coli]GCZ41542.1 hypothetical protein HmCmsJML181_04640 [Escherichia coli]